MYYVIVTISFFMAMFCYLKIAAKYNIIDKPNERSSHTEVVARGGGIIFLFAAVILLFKLPQLWMPLLAIIIIGVISFLDDLYTLSNKLRILIHLLSITIIFYYVNIFTQLSIYTTVLGYIITVGIINAYNFMDGINGITGAYSIIILSGLQYINLTQVKFSEPDVIWLPMLACLVFLCFNFKKKAKCFAGDVGSVTLAFWIIVLMIQLILTTQNLIYILFLSVYGVDAVLTILHRILLKQNIFKAHRLHFYQLLVNEYKFSHLTIAAFYAFLQLLLIILIIKNPYNFFVDITVSIVPLALIYLVYKPVLMKLRNK